MEPSVLRDEDFYAPRCIDTGPWKAMLTREGYRHCPAAEAVFASYGELCIRIGFSQALPSGSTELSFLVSDIARAAHPDYVEFWQKDIGRTLTPVAAVSVEEVLYISQDGSVYRSHFHQLYYHGSDIYAALRDSIVHSTRAPDLVSTIP
jgi:hypothetical protein